VTVPVDADRTLVVFLRESRVAIPGGWSSRFDRVDLPVGERMIGASLHYLGEQTKA
jgi:hypothetical protein